MYIDSLLYFIAAQHGLYLLGWFVAGLIIPHIRDITIRFAVFSLISTLFFVTNAVAAKLANFFVGAISFLIGLLAIIAVRRATEGFLKAPSKVREDMIFMGAWCLGMIVVHLLTGQSYGYQIIAFGTALGMAWLITRALMTAQPFMTKEFGSKVAWLFNAPAFLFAIIFAYRAYLVSDGQPFLFDINSGRINSVYFLLLIMLVSGFTHITYVILIVQRLILSLERQSRHDELTDLPNRRSANEILTTLRELLARHATPFSVIMVDIDDFKSINDRFGHSQGDEVLRIVAETLRSSLRKTDFVARVGGEEFLVILPMTSIELAISIAEKLRQKVEQTPLQISGLNITISLGVSMCRKEDTSYDSVVIRADQALYRSKTSGRNQVNVLTLAP